MIWFHLFCPYLLRWHDHSYVTVLNVSFICSCVIITEFVSWNFVSCNCSACTTARFLRMLKFCSALVNKNIMKRQNSCFTVSDSCYVCVTGHGWSGEEVHGSWPRKLEIHRSCTLQGRLKHLSHRSSSLSASSLLLSCDVSMLTLLLLSLDVASCCLCVHCRVLDL